jgi:excisionase family DNA binding protein
MEWIGTREAAERLGVSRARVQQLIRCRALPAVMVGRDYLLDAAVVRSWRRRPPGRPRKKTLDKLYT